MELPTWADYPWTLTILSLDGEIIKELHRTEDSAWEAAPEPGQAAAWAVAPTRSVHS